MRQIVGDTDGRDKTNAIEGTSLWAATCSTKPRSDFGSPQLRAVPYSHSPILTSSGPRRPYETTETLITPVKKRPYPSRIEGRSSHLPILQKGFRAESRFLGRLSRDRTRTPHTSHTYLCISFLLLLLVHNPSARHQQTYVPTRTPVQFNAALNNTPFMFILQKAPLKRSVRGVNG